MAGWVGCACHSKKTEQFDPCQDSIKVMTLQVSKRLAFPVVAVGHLPAKGEDEREEARRFYVWATRATQWLVIGASGEGRFAARLWAKSKTSLRPR